jgi:hypothetical protein
MGGSTYEQSTAASDSSSTTTVVADPTMYADSSGAVTAGAVTDAADATPAGSQCATDVSQRSGAWACVTDTSTTAAATTASAPTAADTATSLTGWCRSFSGCWWRYDDFHADFQSSQFSYGFGSTRLGSGSMYVNWQLVGAKTTTGPAYVILSSSTTSVTGSVALMNGANNTTGGSLLVGPYFYNWTTAHGPNTRYAWPSTSYVWTREYNSWDHNTPVQFSWHIPGWYGMYWYVWTRSIVSHTTIRNPNAIYRFDPASYETQAPAAAGWRAQ